jgi:hypothetical protein
MKSVWETAPTALLLCHRFFARTVANVEEQVLSRRTLLLHMKWAVASADVKSCGVERKTEKMLNYKNSRRDETRAPVFRGGVGATTEIADTKIFLEMLTTIQQRSDAYLRCPNLE